MDVSVEVGMKKAGKGKNVQEATSSGSSDSDWSGITGQARNGPDSVGAEGTSQQQRLLHSRSGA